jgi:hypothetical protein
MTTQKSAVGSSREPPRDPVNNSDLAIALRRLPGREFARLISQTATPDHGGRRVWRQDGEPGSGAYEALDWDDFDIYITLTGPCARRRGRLSWEQVANWVDAGMTPARLGLIITADRLYSFCRLERDRLSAGGKCDPDAAASELAQIRDDAISTVITAALSRRGAAAPVPALQPGRPDAPPSVLDKKPFQQNGQWFLAQGTG